MKSTSKLALLVALALSLTAFVAAPALATTTTGGVTPAANTPGDATVTPAGAFTSTGTAILTAVIGTVTCNYRATGTGAENGTGTMGITFSNCVDSTGTACTATITSGSVDITIDGSTTTTNPYTVTSAPEAGTVGGASCAVQCTIEVTGAGDFGGSITDGTSPATITITGPVTSNDTSNCGGGSITATGEVTQPNPVTITP